MSRNAVTGLALLVAALALVAAGCGGGDEPASGEVSADEWAEEFCTTVKDWTDEVDRIGEQLADASSLSGDSLQEAADDVDAANQAFVEELRALGAPDTPSGQEVEDSMEALADTVEEERADIEEAVDEASGITGAAEAVAIFGTSLSAMATAFQQTLQALEDQDVEGELETALENAEACDEIAN